MAGSDGIRPEKIEMTVTFPDGETASVLLDADGNDSAWGNVERVLWRTVEMREAISTLMVQEELWAVEEDEDEDEEEDA